MEDEKNQNDDTGNEIGEDKKSQNDDTGNGNEIGEDEENQNDETGKANEIGEDEKNQNDDTGNEIGEEESAISPVEAREAAADVVLNAECQSSSILSSASYEGDDKVTEGDSKGSEIDKASEKMSKETAARGKRAEIRRNRRDRKVSEKGSLVDSKRRTIGGSAKRVALTPAKLAYSATHRNKEKEKAGKEVLGRNGAVKGGMDKSKTALPSVQTRNHEKKSEKSNWRSDRFALGEDEEANPGAIRVVNGRNSAAFSDSESKRASKSSTQRHSLQGEIDHEVDGEVVSAAVIDEEALQKEFENKMKAEMVQAAEVDFYEEPGFLQRHTGKIACLCCVLVLALAIGLGVGLGNSSGSSESATNITNSPTMSPTLRSDVDFLEDLFSEISGSAVFDDATTPQAKALESILNETESGVYGTRDVTEQYLKERYALRVFYYSTHGEGWAISNNNFTSTLETCAWMNGTQGNRLDCNDRDEVTGLSLNVFNLNGTIPSELASLSSLSYVSLAQNMLHGTIPSSLGELSEMKFLQLAFNALSGTIPDSFEKFTKMERFLLHANELTGTMPDIWGNSFTRLRVHDNKMNGTIPAMPSQMPLDWFQVNDNDFSGTLPRNLAAQPKLITLSVSNNRFEGSIPEQFGALTSMQNFVIDGNMFSSSLPNSFGNFEELTWLWVNNNAFTGTLPSSFGLLTTGTQFRFQNNNFEGTLPSDWSSLKKLDLLDVSNNPDLSGTIPASYSSLEKLTTVALQGTQISGGLAESFCAIEPAVSVSAECGGATPTVDCPCCHVCCDGGNCMLRDLNETCLNRADALENHDSFRDNTCVCSEDSMEVKCTETCESCDVDGVSCVRSSGYGSELDPATGESLSFYNDFAYVQGPYNGTVISFREVVVDAVTDHCEVTVNGETCQECRRVQCRSDLVGFNIFCNNLDIPAEINTCDDQAESNYLVAFTFWDRARVSGCPLFLYRILSNGAD
eukprot:scaffold818_cov136-Cylindrotheca_fusiformis.AAC.59